MFRIILQRGVQLLVTLLGITTVLFFLLRLSGDPVAVLLGPNATTEQIETMRKAMGLDQPLLVQYGVELRRLAVLDFGRSIRGGQDALLLMTDRLWVSLQLTGCALLLAWFAALPVGIISAVRRYSPVSHMLMSLTFVGQAMPIFWTGPLLILLFAVTWHLLPTSGWQTLAHVILPAVTLGSVLMAKMARITRSRMLEVLDQDYIETARSKGLSETRVIFIHALKNALIPVVTIMGSELGQLIGSAVLTESIFAIPGLGFSIIGAALARDYPLVQAGVFLVAIVVVLLNAAVDLVYLRLDPRIRYT
jgi:peptide/nickel transport system permease protein